MLVYFNPGFGTLFDMRTLLYISIVPSFHNPDWFLSAERIESGEFRKTREFPRSQLEDELAEYRDLGLIVQQSYSCPGGFSVFEDRLS